MRRYEDYYPETGLSPEIILDLRIIAKSLTEPSRAATARPFTGQGCITVHTYFTDPLLKDRPLHAQDSFLSVIRCPRT